MTVVGDKLQVNYRSQRLFDRDYVGRHHRYAVNRGFYLIHLSPSTWHTITIPATAQVSASYSLSFRAVPATQ